MFRSVNSFSDAPPLPSFLPPRVAWGILLIVVIIAFFVPQSGPIVHETDQSSLLLGAQKLMETPELRQKEFYNYDVQFGSYWLLAALFAVAGQTTPEAIVWLGNIFSCLALVLGLWITGRSLRHWGQFILLIPIALAPSFLMHGPFLATNFFSIFFLSLQFVCMMSDKPLIRWLAPVFALCAVSIRIDATLLQPLLFWLSVREQKLRCYALNPMLWITALLCVGVMFFGRSIMIGVTADVIPFFKFKIIAAYSVFGLGGCILLMLLILAALCWGVFTKPGTRVFLGVGLVFFLIPFVFYASQLYSTRHWTTVLFACAFFCVSPMGFSLIRSMFPDTTLRNVCYGLLLASSVIPIFIGVHMPVFPKFGLTFREPTVFPSADGFVPMGGYLARAWGWDREDRQIPDYNQAIWLAAKKTHFSTTEEGFVPLLKGTLLQPILQHAILAQGKQARVIPENEVEKYGFCYTDTRFLRRGVSSFTTQFENPFSSNDISYAVVDASPNIAGETISQVRPGHNQQGEILKMLLNTFKGDDFHYLQTDQPYVESEPGKAMTILAEAPFVLEDTSGKKRLSEAIGKWHRLSWSDETARPYKFHGISPTSRYILAVSRLPLYMSVQEY